MARKPATGTPPIEHFDMEISTNGFRLGANVYRAFFNGISACNAEATRFTAQRLAKDFDASSQLANCQTPTDVLELQTSFFRTMLLDYVEEAQRMSSLATKVIATGIDTTVSGSD